MRKALSRFRAGFRFRAQPPMVSADYGPCAERPEECRSMLSPNQPHWPQEHMVGWYDIRKLGKTAVDVSTSTVLGTRTDFRLLEALETHQEIFRYEAQPEIWIDYLADVGDGWNPTYTVATLLARDSLHASVSNHPGHRYETTRGQLLIMGGDEVY